MRRILMLNNEFPPLGGGQGVFNELLLRRIAFDRPNLVVDLITASRAAQGYPVEQLAPHITIYRVPVNNIDIHHSRGVELLRYGFRGGLMASALARRHRYDLSMAYSAVPAGPISWWLRKRYGIPYLTRSPGVDIPGFEARYAALYPFLSPVIKTVWRAARWNIVSSEMHRDLMHKADPRSQPRIIPNGVDTKRFSLTPYRSPNSAPVILCVARLVKRKGIEVLLGAFSGLLKSGASARLRLVGQGDDEPFLKRRCQELGVADTVEFLGAAVREQMPGLYQTADLFVLASENEGMSNAALEALACGLPLVLTNVGGASELIAHNENGFIVPVGDSQALQTALERIVGSAELRQRMSAASRARSSRYSIDRVLDEYLELLEAT